MQLLDIVGAFLREIGLYSSYRQVFAPKSSGFE